MVERNNHQYSSEMPGWIWRLAWAAFLAVVGMGAVLVGVLSTGVADPSRAGGTVRKIGPLPELSVPAGTAISTVAILDLPAFPYTLEVTAKLAPNNPPSDLFPTWEIAFEGSPLVIRLYRERYFAVLPSLPDATAFIHIRPTGDSNKLYLNVNADGQGVLRLNDEVAWQGGVPAARRAKILVASGKTGGIFDLQSITLYAPAG